MADNKNEIQYSLGLDTTAFKTGLDEAQADILAAQQMVQRMNTEQQQAPVSQAMPPGTGAPLPPPPTPPFPAPAPTQEQSSVSPIQQAQAELERIRSVAQVSPEIAMLQLQGNAGRGGLQSQIFKGAASANTPEEIEAYQELIKSLRGLTDSVQQQTKEAKDPASSVLNLLRNDMMIRTGSGVAQQFMQGNVVGGMASGAGAGLGMLLGGPAGAAAGAQLGQMLGGILAPFFGGATESEQRAMERSDIAARFGRPETAQTLSVANIARMDTSGYNVDETMRLFDSLRQSRVIDDVDEGSIQLAENIQALSRALGLNTDALVQNYSAYRTQGGEQGVNEFMNQQIAGAVSAGMKENLSDYLDLTSSSSRQLVANNFDTDANGGGMRRIQQMLTGLVGQDNRMGGLLRDNPAMAQQMMSSLLSTGTTNDPFGIQSVMMRAAGVQGNQMLAGFATPEQQATNALQQVSYINQRFLGSNFNSPELQAQAQSNPNFVRDSLLSSEQSQIRLNQLIAEQYTGGNAAAVTPEQRAMVTQMMQLQLSNGGSLTPEMAMGDGQTVQDILNDYQKSDTAAIRESIEKASTSLDELGEIIQPIFSEFRSVMPDLLRGLIGGLEDITTETGPELKAAWSEFKPVLTGELIPAISSLSQVITSVLGNNLVQGAVGGLQSVSDIAENPIAGTARTVGRVINAAGSMPTTPAGVGMALGRNVVSRGIESLRDRFFGDDNDQKIDAAFNDTPSSGILATQEFNTFQFAPGDRVFAQQQGGGSGGSPLAGMSAPITIQQHFHGAAEPELVEVAARQGSQAGFDEFVERWQARDTSSVKLFPTNY